MGGCDHASRTREPITTGGGSRTSRQPDIAIAARQGPAHSRACLRAVWTQKSHFEKWLFCGMSGRGKRIRTSGPCVPNAVLYQAELFPDDSSQKKNLKQQTDDSGLSCRLMVGERGFEPPAPASRTQCSTRLSYSPTSYCTTTNCCCQSKAATPNIELRLLYSCRTSIFSCDCELRQLYQGVLKNGRGQRI